ncbi:potassium channel subfamily K member 16-like isoform X1 [Anneissia japonica]|uniref:potassium channel subfamily K member 16-like isoform X1 n=1 Tax=Anneissia japonica TaxID=1529436 RepID=UPI001425A17A|nr:potassium channel subfamily K member 16-like isoform X1 [Anneissia japonica]XP_033109143.1 potassium channel subfamily K member 16-like isoform X1 [Anneissia japonica]
MEDNSSNSYVTGKKLFVLWVIFLLYLLFGGLIFSVLEKGNEDIQRKRARITKKEFIYNYTCLDASSLEDLISTLLEIQAQGVDPRENVTGPSKWDFTSSLFFSGTVVTTIGYGNIAPSSRAGQQFCICYALIGIPLCGFVLAELSNRVKNRSLKFKERVMKIWKKNKENRAEVFYMAMICTSGFFLFFTIPAVIFALVEDWSYHLAFYYCFITLSTIGFGDYVAGTNPKKHYSIFYRIAIYIWIILGLAYFILLLQHVSDVLEHAGKKIKKRTRTIREIKKGNGKEVNEEKKEVCGECWKTNRESLTSKKDIKENDEQKIIIEQVNENTIETEADVNIELVQQQPARNENQPINVQQPNDAEMEMII